MAIVFVDHFIRSYSEAPRIMVLDVDDTANVVHGYQQMALFNGYYQENCYEPMHLYEGLSGKLIAIILRPGRRPNGREIVAYMRRIINHIRQQWPDSIIVYRGDSHYSLPEVFTLLAGQKDCYSVTGLGSNAVLLKHVTSLIEEVRQQAAGYRRYQTFFYQAQRAGAYRTKWSPRLK
jgi:hypothetical protein